MPLVLQSARLPQVTFVHNVEQQTVPDPLLMQCPLVHSPSAPQALPSAFSAAQVVPEQ